jgi:hypothetical protein
MHASIHTKPYIHTYMYTRTINEYVCDTVIYVLTDIYRLYDEPGKTYPGIGVIYNMHVGVATSPECDTFHVEETVTHYLCECVKFEDIRETLRLKLYYLCGRVGVG